MSENNTNADRYVGNRWEDIDHACRLAEQRKREREAKEAK